MAMKLEDYANKYKTIKFERRDGILQMTLHSQGKELKWGAVPHEECCWAFADVARDPENQRGDSDRDRRGLLRRCALAQGRRRARQDSDLRWAPNLQEAKHLL